MKNTNFVNRGKNLECYRECKGVKIEIEKGGRENGVEDSHYPFTPPQPTKK